MTPRPILVAALALAAGAAQAQTAGSQTTTTTSRTTTTQPAAQGAGQGATPMTPVSPMSPAAPGTAGTSSTATSPSTTQPTSPTGSTTAPSGAAFAAITPAPGADVVAVLTQSGQFSTFLKAADATALTSVLKTPGLTVFAPTDSAFAALPAGTLDNLMKAENLPQLQKLLALHLVNTKIPSIKGHSQTQLTTAAGSKITVDGSGEQVKVNDATALQRAVAVGNGATIYPIDKVLSPDFTPPPAPAADATAAAATTTDDTAAAATTTRKSTTTTRKKR